MGIESSRRATELDPDAYSPWHCGLCAWSATDNAREVQRASAAFSEALERRDPQLFQYVHLEKIFPKFAVLRAHPGWAGALEASGLDAYLRARSLSGAAT